MAKKKPSKFSAWVDKAKSLVGLSSSTSTPEPEPPKETPPRPQSEAPQILDVKALNALRVEQDNDQKITLCENFLDSLPSLANDEIAVARAEVEDILAIALKTRGVELAKKAYGKQMKGEDSKQFNPGKKFNPKNLDQKDLIMSDLRDHTGSGLSEDEVLAIRTYTASNYSYINPAIANQKDREDRPGDWMDFQKKPDPSKAQSPQEKLQLEKALKEYEEHGKKSLYEEGALHAGMIMEAFKKLPKMSGKLYRGARMNQARFDREYGGKKPVEYEAFVSSAVDPSVARGFANGYGDVVLQPDATISVFVEANILDARDIMALSVYGDSEKEWLVPPGTKLEVESIEDESDQPRGNPTAPAATAWKKVVLKQIVK